MTLIKNVYYIFKKLQRSCELQLNLLNKGYLYIEGKQYFNPMKLHLSFIYLIIYLNYSLSFICNNRFRYIK